MILPRTQSTRRLTRALALSALIALPAMGLGGCNQTNHATQQAIILYHEGNFAAAAQLLKPDTTKKDENFVLANCRYGSCALAAYEFDQAEQAFLAAYEVMNGVNTNDGGRTLGAALVFEGIKVWKGEPFERAMAHYYLGLIYLRKGDYGNARAAFENSLFKVREYAKIDDEKNYTEVESTFALGYFGLGFCELRTGRPDRAQTAFNLALKNNPGLAQLIADVQRPGTNTLIFVDGGYGPRKAAKGWYDEESVFGPKPSEVAPIPTVVAMVDGQQVNNPRAQYSTVDTLAMAQERRWQDIDTMKKAKAVIGTGMMAGGAGVAAYGASRNDSGTTWAGIGLLAAGALVSASSQSDVRAWEMLPRTVYIIPAALAPGQHTISVNAGGGATGNVQVLSSSPTTGHPADNIVYFRLP